MIGAGECAERKQEHARITVPGDPAPEVPPRRPEKGLCCSLGTEKSSRDHRDPTSAPVGVRPGSDHRRVEEGLADLVAKPPQVLDVVVSHTRELDVQRNPPAVAALDDRAHLMGPAGSTEMSETRFGPLCKNSHTRNNQGLEQASQHSPIADDGNAPPGPSKRAVGPSPGTSAASAGSTRWCLGAAAS